MNHQKEDVFQAAEGLWPDIFKATTTIDERIFNGKHQPCPVCGGKDRFRYIRKHDKPFMCNQCGSYSNIEFFMELTGYTFSDSINIIGDHLRLIPHEQIEVKKREYQIATSFPDWYKFDFKLYDSISKKAEIDLSLWQIRNGLQMLDILKHGENALLPLLNEQGKPVDFVMVNPDGEWQTTAGNKTIPSGFHSVIGSGEGKYKYICVSPFHACHASVFMQREVICCYDVSNIWDCIKQHEDGALVIVSNIDEVLEADSIKMKQLTFNTKNNTVSRRLWEVGEIVREKNSKS